MTDYKEHLARIPENEPQWRLRLELAYERAMREIYRRPVLPWGVWLFIGLYLAAVCCIVTWQLKRDCMREEAVKHAAAHWEVSDNGEASFHWNAEESRK